MVTTEREMLKKPVEPAVQERSTSLQPTYEDSVPAAEDDWELEDE
ncbi:hypothetical protein [Granulicella arctica]|nr:hypothetical protein [Granulicella arctica]